MQLFIALSALIVSLIVALFVYVKNPRSGTHLYFSLLVFFISVYPLFNYLAVNSESNEVALSWAKLILLVSIPQGPLLFFFASVFPKKEYFFRLKIQLVVLAWMLINIVLASLGLIFKSVSIEDGVVSLQPGPLGPSFALLHISTIIAGLVVLFRKRQKSRNQDRSQLNYIFFGILFSFSLTFLITIVLPVLFKNTVLLSISPLFLSVAVIAAAYAIVSQKLFDIRGAIVRSVAYLFVSALIVASYVFVTFFIRSIFFPDHDLGSVELVTSVFLVGALVLTFDVTRRAFNKFTNKFFFRDSYDPQEFVDQLNKSIVSNIEIGILLRHTAAIIQENLKCNFVHIVIPKTESMEGRIVGTVDADYSEHELNYMRGRLVGLGRKIVASEDLGPEEDELRKIYNKRSISVLVHLAATSYGQSQTIAYVIFGNKKSGNIYSKADLKIVDIIADELVIAIQNALRFEEIQDFNVTLQNKVNPATNKLRRTNEKLKAMDETKDEFISMASHQLRTPLTSVKGYLSMVLEGDAGEINDTQRKLLDQAFVSSQRMVYLIADLLNVSRLRTGKFIIDAHPANLAEMVSGEISQLVGQARAKGITLTFNKPDDFPDLLIDETKTRQVIMNFVDNALFYTPSDGKIEISLTEDKGHVYFQVKDNGLGVPKDEQKHLFTKFYRAKNARNIRPDGTGLGLFMAKKVITAQGGNILFSSTEGKGSTFGFSFNKKHLALDRPVEEINRGSEG